ncbi:MAG: DUF427 domain-containing protein [Gammaproteobacteria bacterium]|nr:DUF427 domain-containing protein [Gammaproteobacteria bacterium]MBA3730977.1 DUF427 domain-containing protein [Gammaproteobacteria bacterium]
MKSIPDWIARARGRWRYSGQERPPFAIAPQPGQESVWDYPRPPRIERDTREVVVRVGETVIARSNRSLRVLETASPPTFYLPPQDPHAEFLTPSAGGSHCEWKGEARYWSVVIAEQRLESIAWSYPHPLPGFESLAGYCSFYPARIECYVDSARVQPQPGRFYGGWVTPELVGPFKGEPGTEGW